MLSVLYIWNCQLLSSFWYTRIFIMWPQATFSKCNFCLWFLHRSPYLLIFINKHTVYASSSACAAPSAYLPSSLCPCWPRKLFKQVSLHHWWLSWPLDKLMPTLPCVSIGLCPPLEWSPSWTFSCSPSSLGKEEWAPRRQTLCCSSLHTLRLTSSRGPAMYKTSNESRMKEWMNGWTLNIKRVRLKPGMRGEENETGWNKVVWDLHIERRDVLTWGREARFIITGRKESRPHWAEQSVMWYTDLLRLMVLARALTIKACGNLDMNKQRQVMGNCVDSMPSVSHNALTFW